MRIVLLEPLGISEEKLSELSERLTAQGHDFTAYESCTLDTAELGRRVGNADAVILANHPLPGQVIRGDEQLKFISVAFVGIDHIDVDACREKGIVISNTGGYCDDAVAELAIGLTLDCLRQISRGDASVKAGGGKATRGQDGWWAKTDLVLPLEHEEDKVSDIPEQSEAETGDVIRPVPYVFAELPEGKMSAADYAAAENRDEICRRANAILEAEAPILRDVLIRKLMSSFGVGKGAAALEATEKAIKAAKIKSTKQKGIVFCWAAGQNPKAYYGLRVSNERSADEICPQELRNAIVYALQTKGELPREDLIKEASLVLGYKRLGKNLEAALTAGVQFARASGAIVYVHGGKFRLP